MHETLSWDLIISLKNNPSCLTLLWPISLYVNRIAPALQVFVLSSKDCDDLGISPGPLQCRLSIQSWPGTTLPA